MRGRPTSGRLSLCLLRCVSSYGTRSGRIRSVPRPASLRPDSEQLFARIRLPSEWQSRLPFRSPPPNPALTSRSSQSRVSLLAPSCSRQIYRTRQLFYTLETSDMDGQGRDWISDGASMDVRRSALFDAVYSRATPCISLSCLQTALVREMRLERDLDKGIALQVGPSVNDRRLRPRYPSVTALIQ